MTAIFAIVKRLLASDKISFILTALVVLWAMKKSLGSMRHDFH